MAGRVLDVFDEADAARALTIARTETGQAANTATFSAYKGSGVIDRKQWVATPDDKTRDSHRSMLSSDPINIDKPFDVDGEDLMYPGDPNGSAENTINCRCAVIGVVNDPYDEEMLGSYWKGYDAALTEWEGQTTEALRRGFSKQKKNMLETLDNALSQKALDRCC
jgi:uncharacterized protein with gpF-like domain